MVLIEEVALESVQYNSLRLPPEQQQQFVPVCGVVIVCLGTSNLTVPAKGNEK